MKLIENLYATARQERLLLIYYMQYFGYFNVNSNSVSRYNQIRWVILNVYLIAKAIFEPLIGK